jgi:hypothetical protein
VETFPGNRQSGNRPLKRGVWNSGSLMPYRSATARIRFVLLEASCFVAQSIEKHFGGESGTVFSPSNATGIHPLNRQADVVRSISPRHIRPRCSCNESSRSALEGRSSRLCLSKMSMSRHNNVRIPLSYRVHPPAFPQQYPPMVNGRIAAEM